MKRGVVVVVVIIVIVVVVTVCDSPSVYVCQFIADDVEDDGDVPRARQQRAARRKSTKKPITQVSTPLQCHGPRWTGSPVENLSAGFRPEPLPLLLSHQSTEGILKHWPQTGPRRFLIYQLIPGGRDVVPFILSVCGLFLYMTVASCGNVDKSAEKRSFCWENLVSLCHVYGRISNVTGIMKAGAWRAWFLSKMTAEA